LLGRVIAAVGAAGDLDLMVEVKVKRQTQQAARRLLGGAERGQRQLLPGTQPARIVDVAQRGDRGMGLGLLDPGADQDVHQGVAALHLDLLGRPRPIEQRGLGEPRLVSALGVAGEPVDQPVGQRQAGDLARPEGRLEGPRGRALRGDRLRQVGQRLMADQGGGAAEPASRHEPARRQLRQVDRRLRRGQLRQVER
jgi:hypothetical protein